MNIVNETGGARIGWANATWPFASLKVTETELILNATIVGKLIFNPSDIKSIVVYDYLPVIGQGIKINHNVGSYKDNVIFWTFKNPADLIKEIEATGFLNPNAKESTENSSKISEMQNTGGFPLKLTFALAVIVLWNLLSFIDIKTLIQDGKVLFGFGKGFLLSTGVVLLASILMLVSPGFQKVALKEGREIKDFSKFIYFIILIVGILFISRVFVDL
jgi:hypothetical protein